MIECLTKKKSYKIIMRDKLSDKELVKMSCVLILGSCI